MPRRCVWVGLVGCMLLAVNTLQAQEKRLQLLSPKDNFGIIFSYSLPNAKVADGGASVNWGRKLRYYQVSFDRTVGLWWSDFPSISMNSLSASVGLASLGRYHTLSVFGGPAFVWGQSEDADLSDADDPRFATVGAHLNAQAMVQPLRYLGVGVVLYSNLNAHESVTTLRFALKIGGKAATIR